MELYHAKIDYMEVGEYTGKKITILGLGRYEHGSGIAAVKFFIDQGADLLITDLQSEEELAHQVERVKRYATEKNYQGNLVWGMGGHKEEYITQADLLVPNPGVPVTSSFVQLAQENGVLIESEMSLFFKRCPAKIIGVTGTRGKSTTTALIHHFLQSLEKKIWLGGNIAKSSPLEFLSQIKADDMVVLELSNFMLEYLNLQKLSPDIAVLLNVLPDHLSRYAGGMDEYAGVKEVITKYQDEEGVLICNQQNRYTHEIGKRTKARVIWFDPTNPATPVNLQLATLVGEHNQANILAAVVTAEYLGLSQEQIENTLGSFRPLEGRLQFVDEINGVTFINDTTSTTPVAGIAAIEALRDRPIVLIAGGADKGLSFSEFAQELSKLKAVILLPGKGTEGILEAIKKESISVELIEAGSMSDAVKLAHSRAESGDIVLLSPACSSFGLFKNEFDRGEQFDQFVQNLPR